MRRRDTKGRFWATQAYAGELCDPYIRDTNVEVRVVVCGGCARGWHVTS